MSGEGVYDILVVGGGINGVGIARDAAGRGLDVLLVERGDLGEHTSSASTKLIHGGLRYLEHYEFRLVREALAERERLLRLAPHIIWPLRFILPYDRGLRPAWLLRLGLFFYDHLALLRALPRSGPVTLAGRGLGAPLKVQLARGFAYSDCWVDDARLVVLNALDAAERGASIQTRTALDSARRQDGLWCATLEDTETREWRSVRARILVNATGPWVGDTLRRSLQRETRSRIRHVKGSHIVVPRLYDGEHAYIFQQPDKRVVFAIPYERDFTLIGTTEMAYEGDLARPAISTEEIRYLCDSVNRSLSVPVVPDDIVWSYSGIRPLFDDSAAEASAVTRDYVLEIDAAADQAPLLSVFGGKITTYRRLAEQALGKLAPFIEGSRPAWTEDAPLPGGDIDEAAFDPFLQRLLAAKPFLPETMARRLARAYGTRVFRLLGDATRLADLGEAFDGGLTLREIEYLVRTEWARTPDDILWRRTKLGLRTGRAGVARLAALLAQREAV